MYQPDREAGVSAGPYRDQWELMGDQFALIDYRLYLYYKNHQWLGPSSEMRNMLGLAVSREEFEHNLTKAAQTGLYAHIFDEERASLEQGEVAVGERLAQTSPNIPLLRLFERFALDDFGKAAVTLAYAAYLDDKYGRMFAYLQDDITKRSPGISLAVQLYLPEGCSVEEYRALFHQKSLLVSLFEAEALERGDLVLCPEVTEYLSAGTITPGAGIELFDGAAEETEAPPVIGEELAQSLDAALYGGASVVAIAGPVGGGRRFQLRHLMHRRKETCLFMDMEAMGYEPRSVDRTALLSRLLGAYVCFHSLESLDAENNVVPPSSAVMDAILHAQLYRSPLFLTSQMPLRLNARGAVTDLRIEPATSKERLALFAHYLADAPLNADVSLPEIAGKFRFTPLQIRRAAEQAEGNRRIMGITAIDSRALHKSCYRQSVHKLDKLAVQIEPRYTWEDVVLPAPRKQLMHQACMHIRYAHRVYQEWGFERKIGYGRGLSILFAGAPGTGKTMCAQVMAKELNMEVYKINISQIVSKYIGETEKNLQAVFNEARHSNCILFFDECDAIFGKRSEVKDAHDRNANVEVAYLLQQIEDHDGVCILATNLIQNIDAAFMRRITYVVDFPFPDAAMRKEIYLRTLPEEAPKDPDVDWDFIARKFALSGGYIKNIVLSAAFMAAAADVSIGMRQILNAAVNEMHKNGIVVVREELGEYADLID